MSYLGVGVSPGTVPVYHSTNLKLFDKRIKIGELVLRFMILGLGVVAAVLIGTDSQVKVFFSFEKEAKFTDVKALVFLVVANGLAAGYSLIQGLRCVVSLVRGSVLFNKPLAWAIFSSQIIKILASTSCFFLENFVAMLINITYFFINSCKDIIKNFLGSTSLGSSFSVCSGFIRLSPAMTVAASGEIARTIVGILGLSQRDPKSCESRNPMCSKPTPAFKKSPRAGLFLIKLFGVLVGSILNLQMEK
ncbi:hypothetical protein Ahy_A09g045166 isoform A [Arachis hypogaea]|uniref:CASP-like protein n=1 Tax=Arachis hypogaea TaxID=3818 RepID=A0A445BLQ9_ARAHY|nr:hypothetical protein Ahy_A09g045166 isoform A [Arachis hypogaea]